MDGLNPRQKNSAEIWLNRIYLGSGAWGVDAASRLYFGVSAREVNFTATLESTRMAIAPTRLQSLDRPRSLDAVKQLLSFLGGVGFRIRLDQLAEPGRGEPLPVRVPSEGAKKLEHVPGGFLLLGQFIGRRDCLRRRIGRPFLLGFRILLFDDLHSAKSLC